MKTNNLFIFIITIVFAACSEDDGPILSVVPFDAIHFSSEAKVDESVTIEVGTNQESWDVVSNRSWCNVTKGNNRFTISAEPNTSISPPSPAKVTVTAGEAMPVIIEVTQEGAKPYITLTPNEDIYFTQAADNSENVIVTVETNELSWSVVSDKTWCKVIKSDETFIVRAEPNSSVSARTPAKVTVTAANVDPVVINVMQYGSDPYLTILPEGDIHFTADAEESENVVVTVNTNETTWNAVSNQAWCKVNIDNNTFTVSAEPNTSKTPPKPAVITVTAGGADPVKINVTQEEFKIKLAVGSNKKIHFTADAAVNENKTIAVNTNAASWEVESDQAWCKVTKNIDSFTVSAEPNEAETSRAPTAKITISAEDATPIIIEVTQGGVFNENNWSGTWYGRDPNVVVSFGGVEMAVDDIKSLLPEGMNFNETLVFEMEPDKSKYGNIMVKMPILSQFNLPTDAVSLPIQHDTLAYKTNPEYKVLIVDEPIAVSEIPFLSGIEIPGFGDLLSDDTMITEVALNFNNISLTFGPYGNESIPFTGRIVAPMSIKTSDAFLNMMIGLFNPAIGITINSTLQK